ncbi:hypothetical protein HDZ31DRAFT_69234 [Schizophyllum fasciatum]
MGTPVRVMNGGGSKQAGNEATESFTPRATADMDVVARGGEKQATAGGAPKAASSAVAASIEGGQPGPRHRF